MHFFNACAHRGFMIGIGGIQNRQIKRVFGIIRRGLALTRQPFIIFRKCFHQLINFDLLFANVNIDILLIIIFRILNTGEIQRFFTQ